MIKIFVIGIGYRPLDARAKELMLNAEIILASKRLYEVFQRYAEFETVKDRIMVINRVDETIEFIRSSISHLSSSIVLIASGDPLFFGIGRKALDEFGTELVEILPDLSSVQLAFSRIKTAWDDAFLMSLHGGPDPDKRRRLPYEIKDIPMLLKKHHKIAVLTDRENNPAVIASFLRSSPDAQHSSLHIYVCERLGYEDERITEGGPRDISEMTFNDPNVVIIINGGETSACHSSTVQQHDLTFGLIEKEISHSRGLITKDEVRAVTLHKLQLPKSGVFWDIGAGSGSISIEAAGLCSGLAIYSIEKDSEQLRNISENIDRFGIENMTVINGEAPSALNSLPAPDRVFIGGSGGRLSDIVRHVSKVMQKGTVVINSTTIETLSGAAGSLEESGFEVEVVEMSVSRSKRIAGKLHMSALNPVFIIKGDKI